MRIRCVSVLVMCLLAAPVVAQERLVTLQALNAAASQPARMVAAESEAGLKNPAGFWFGLALLAGGGTMAVLSATSQKKETCVAGVGYGYVAVTCESEVNKAMLYAGLGVIAGGGFLSALSASVTDRGIAVAHTWGF